MIYDNISACNGFKCPLRDGCFRYFLFKKYRRKKTQFWQIVAACEDGKCSRFIENELTS